MQTKIQALKNKRRETLAVVLLNVEAKKQFFLKYKQFLPSKVQESTINRKTMAAIAAIVLKINRIYYRSVALFTPPALNPPLPLSSLSSASFALPVVLVLS